MVGPSHARHLSSFATLLLCDVVLERSHRITDTRVLRLIGQKVCPEHLFTPLRTGTLSRDAIRPRQAPLPISAERRPRLP